MLGSSRWWPLPLLGWPDENDGRKTSAHFFDGIYYPILTARAGLPYGYWVHGNNDVEGARRAIESITGALGWLLTAQPLLVTGTVDATVRASAEDLGATLAASIME